MPDIMEIPSFRRDYKDDLHFSCVSGCGKCCNSPPELSLLDGFRYFRDFPLTATITVIRDDSSEDSQAKRWLDLGGVEFKSKFQKFVAYSTFTPLYRRGLRRCPMLTDEMSCSIYERRPDICKAVPVRVSSPCVLRRQIMEARLLDDVKTRGYLCDLSADAPILFRGRELNPESGAGKGMLSCEDDYSKTGFISYGIVSGFLGSISIEQHDFSSGFVVFEVPVPAIFVYAISFYLNIVAKDNGELTKKAFPESVVSLLSSADYTEIRSAQMSLLKNLIADSLAAKDRDDRPGTALARSTLAVWEKAPDFPDELAGK